MVLVPALLFTEPTSNAGGMGVGVSHDPSAVSATFVLNGEVRTKWPRNQSPLSPLKDHESTRNFRFQNHSILLLINLFIHQPSNSAVRHLPKKNESIYPREALYKNVNSNLVHNCPKVQATQMSVNSMYSWTFTRQWKETNC